MVNHLAFIVSRKGIRGLYSGFKPFVVQASGKAAVRFYCYGSFANTLAKAGFSRQNNPTAFSVLCGLGAGTCEAIFWTCPTERIKVLNQSSRGTYRFLGLLSRLFVGVFQEALLLNKLVLTGLLRFRNARSISVISSKQPRNSWFV